MIPTLLVISVVAFAVIELPPGDFLTQQMAQWEELYGDRAEVMIENMRAIYGLDGSAIERYYRWITRIVFHGDFGRSFLENTRVTDIIMNRVFLTMGISLVTLFFTWIVAIPIGVYSAVKQYSFFDYLFTFFAFIGRAFPNFALALVLMYVAYTYFDWPIGGLMSRSFRGEPLSMAKIADVARHMVIPVIVIGTHGLAGLVRVLRAMILDEMNKEYVQTARSKGLSERVVIWKHVFIIACQPIVSTIGWLLPQIVSGAAIVSIVMNLPTTGEALLSALTNQDMYVAASFILVLSTLTLIGTLISDLLLAFIDPRIRYN